MGKSDRAAHCFCRTLAIHEAVGLDFLQKAKQAISKKDNAGAVIHAGWRGTALNTAGKTVRKMRENLNIKPEEKKSEEEKHEEEKEEKKEVIQEEEKKEKKKKKNKKEKEEEPKSDDIKENEEIKQENNIENKEEENKENNIINNNENNNEKNKAIIKKSQEEEKYENIIIDLCGNNEIIELFESKKWEEKKQGFQKLNQFLNENLENDIIKNNFENIFMFISMKLNNFKETNFNLLKEGIISFNILFSYSKEKNINTLNKKYLETIIYNLNEKICDSKIKDNYIQLLNNLNDLYSYKTVYELLFEILLKTNKINVLKEYSLLIKENIKKENSINNFDLKHLIEFVVKLANNTNPQIRTIAIEIIGLLYTFIGGPVLGLLYKSVNTMDSMIGYKNDRYMPMTRK